jgi:2-phosphoglycerate kinase
MLLCDEHHRLIDKVQVVEHPAERLIKMKHQHEIRIDLLSRLAPEKRSHVVLYGSNIGVHTSPLTYREAATSLLPENYPAEPNAISLSLKKFIF